jgi:hypothetical protein
VVRSRSGEEATKWGKEGGGVEGGRMEEGGLGLTSPGRRQTSGVGLGWAGLGWAERAEAGRRRGAGGLTADSCRGSRDPCGRFGPLAAGEPDTQG